MSDAAPKALAAVAGLGFVYYFPKIFTTLRDWEYAKHNQQFDLQNHQRFILCIIIFFM